MPFAGFQQALRCACTFLASLSLSLWPQAPVATPLDQLTPPPTKHLPYRTNCTDRLRFGTFNVQSLGSLIKQLDTLPRDLQRYRVDVLGLQETKVYKFGRYEIGDYTLLTLPATHEHHGIGFAVSPRLVPYLRRYWAHSDRIGILQLRLPQVGLLNIVTAYAPHSGRPLTEVDTFFADLRSAIDQFARRDITVITGDFNAKLGRRTTEEHFLGPHDRGVRNRNGRVLAEFCDTYRFFATNTAFQKRARHKTNWSQRRQEHPVYNQIDYVLCQQNCRCLCLDAQSWGGTLTSSDHKLVTADFLFVGASRLRFSPSQRRRPVMKLACANLVHDDDTRTTYARTLKDLLPEAKDDDGTSVAKQWDSVFKHVQDAANQTTGLQPSRPNQHRRYNDPVLAQLSELQCQLRLRIYNDMTSDLTSLRRQRNKNLHQIRDRCRELANRDLDDTISRIEATSDSFQMFEAVRGHSRKAPQRLLLRDDTDQFLDKSRTAMAEDTTAQALTTPVTPEEFRQALCRLNNGQAAGPDNIPAELLKYAADELAPRLAELLNRSFERGELLALGAGTLLCLQKPNKPRVCSSLRPIVLLDTIRKAISLIVLHRITPAVDKYLSAHQSGFHRFCSTADAVWAHKWLCARVQKFQNVTHVLGIDLSRAFDTIDRAQLIKVLQTFLHDDEIRLIRLLLSDTTLTLRVDKTRLQPFLSNTGTPQGDSLSPVLFVIYLEAAFRDLASHPAMPPDLLDQMIVYADDADFICHDSKLVELIQTHAPTVLARWSLTMNTTKTELTKLERCMSPSPKKQAHRDRGAEEAWKGTRKLGSLLGDMEDVSRRKTLAAAALRTLWTVWIRPHKITDKTRIRLYNCYVLPILLYNCGTWALTPTQTR